MRLNQSAAAQPAPVEDIVAEETPAPVVIIETPPVVVAPPTPPVAVVTVEATPPQPTAKGAPSWTDWLKGQPDIIDKVRSGAFTISMLHDAIPESMRPSRATVGRMAKKISDSQWP